MEPDLYPIGLELVRMMTGITFCLDLLTDLSMETSKTFAASHYWAYMPQLLSFSAYWAIKRWSLYKNNSALAFTWIQIRRCLDIFWATRKFKQEGGNPLNLCQQNHPHRVGLRRWHRHHPRSASTPSPCRLWAPSTAATRTMPRKPVLQPVPELSKPVLPASVRWNFSTARKGASLSNFLVTKSFNSSINLREP